MFTAGITEFNLPKEGIAITLENPTGDYTDTKTLQRIQGVTDQLIKDWTCRPKAGWIRKCLKTETERKAELCEKIDARLPKWKAERKGEGVSYASKSMFIDATKRFHDLSKDIDTDSDILHKLLTSSVTRQRIRTAEHSRNL